MKLCSAYKGGVHNLKLTYSVSVDIGTTGCRIELFNSLGESLAKKSAEYALQIRHFGWAEQDPEEIYAAIMRCLREIPMNNVDAIVLSSPFHSFTALNASGTLISPLLTWYDNRAIDEASNIKADLPGLYERTACPSHPMYLPAKILWFKHNFSDCCNIRKFIGIKEYVISRWFGRFLVDRSIASGSGLYNFHTDSWDRELLTYLGVNEDQLSQIVDTTYQIVVNRESPLTEVGLRPGTVCVLGAGDGVLSSLGVGAVRKGQLTAAIGESGAVRIISRVPKVDARARTWCYYLSKDWWVLGGAINNGGIAYRWIRDNFMQEEVELAKKNGWDSYEVINQKVMEIPPGAEGLICLPYLTGERSPHWNANVRGIFLGLGLNHTRYHMARATIEGVAFRMYSVFLALQELGGPVNEVLLTGGVSRSPLWVQTFADVFQREVLLSRRDASSFGAWILLQYAQGHIKSLTEADQFAGNTEIYQPRTELEPLYAELYDLYNRVYTNLQGEFMQISNLQRRLSMSDR